jgi:transferrin binding protein
MKRRVCAVLVTAALAGCASGGGGSGGPSGPVSPPVSDSSSPPSSDSSSPPASFEFPTLTQANSGTALRGSDAVQFDFPEAFDDAGRTSVSANGNGVFTVRVRGNPPDHDRRFESLEFQINLRDSSVPLGSVPGTSCGNCVRVRQDGTGTFTILYLDPEAAGMQYSTIGGWDRPGTGAARGGVAPFGVVTRTADIPRTGTAHYSGQFIGRYIDDRADSAPGQRAQFVVGAIATANANFGTGVVAFDTTNSHANGEPRPTLDLFGRMASGMRTNQMQGTAETKIPSMTGTMSGTFFGPTANELGGSVRVRDGSQQNMVGGFVMKR